jgi:hypothetical protein
VTGFFLALLAALLAGAGARDQVIMAQLSRLQGARPAALAVGIVTSTATAALAAWLSLGVAPMLNGHARLFLAGLALGFAGAEMFFMAQPKAPREPTRSLAALAVVLAAHQITDAVRFLIFAIGLAAYSPTMAAAGGAIAGAVLLGTAWTAPDLLARPGTRIVRRVIGVLLLVVGIVLAVSAMQAGRAR